MKVFRMKKPSEQILKFTPLLDDTVKKLIDNKTVLRKLAISFGSPLNIIFPKNIRVNIQQFDNVIKKHRIYGKIFYAHKANKSASVMRELAANSNMNVDVASLNELKSALSNGFTADRIEATGPKNIDFLRLGLQHNIVFNVDNMDELRQILSVRKALNSKWQTRVLLRISNLDQSIAEIKSSRFGVDVKDVNQVLQFLVDNVRELDLLGFSFHLDTVSIDEKVNMISECFSMIEKTVELGLSPSAINIGGGFKMNYLKSESEWNASLTILRGSLVNGNDDLTWNGAKYGMNTKDGKILSDLNIYEFYNELTAGRYLDEIMSVRLNGFQGRTVAEMLTDNMIDLYIEPGKALLSQVGITVARVNFVKKAGGKILVGLDMNQSDIQNAGREMFIDPIIISSSPQLDREVGVFMVGNLCAEYDLIFNRKVYLNQIPRSGDLIVFPNSAGYFMDFNADTAIQHDIAKKIYVKETNGEFEWGLDDNYDPLNI